MKVLIDCLGQYFHSYVWNREKRRQIKSQDDGQKIKFHIPQNGPCWCIKVIMSNYFRNSLLWGKMSEMGQKTVTAKI